MSNQPIESAQIIRRSGSIAEIPPRFSLVDMLLGQAAFIKPPAHRIGTPKADKWCKGCKTNHPARDFVMDDGTVSLSYCKTKRLGIIAKKLANELKAKQSSEKKQLELRKVKDAKINKRRPMPVCELAKVF